MSSDLPIVFYSQEAPKIREGAQPSSRSQLMSILTSERLLHTECEEKACKQAKHHFDHCQEKVSEGHHKGEDCVEELFHLMHCVE